MKAVNFGEIMMRLSPPHYRRIVQAETFDAVYGGSEANVAISLANFGINSYYATSLPNNELGRGAAGHLRRFGVKTKYIHWTTSGRLGLYFLEQGAGQRSSNVIYDRQRSAITDIKAADIDWSGLLQGSDWFHWSGITPALGDGVVVALEKACKTAQKLGVTISCDLNYRSKLWSTEKAQSIMRPLMKYVDVCIAGVGSAHQCLGTPTSLDSSAETSRQIAEEIGHRLKADFDFQSVAMTLRESLSASRHRYSAMLIETEPVYSRTYEIDIVDRVGGGDAFAAGLIAGLLQQDSERAALDFAVAAAALKHTIPGDSNLVSRNEVEELAASPQSGRVSR